VAKSAAWLALLTAVVVWFFHESLFQGRSLVPTDLVHNLMLPYSARVARVQVQNHYAMDAAVSDYPWGLFWQQSVTRDGELPLWNPFILGGHPNLADTMPAVLSPFKLLYLVLPAERAFTLGIVLEIALAGWLMFGLLRELGRSRPASFIGGCAWMLNSGFLMWYWRAPNIFCWAPLVLWLLERSARRDSWPAAAGAALTLGVALLSGNIQAGAHLGFLCAMYGLWMVWWSGPGRRARTLARVGAALAAGALVAAVQWLPALELMRLDVYGGTQARGASASWRHTLLGLPALITFVFPAMTGSTESYDLLKLANASRYIFTGYIGVVPFTFFVVGVAACRREWRVRAGMWIIIAVVVLLFFTPLVKYLYHRFFVVAVFAMAMLAAYGADAATEGKGHRVWFWMGMLCVVVLAGVLAVQCIVHFFGDRLIPAAERYVAGKAEGYAFSFRPEWFIERVHEFFRHYRVTNVEFWLPALAVVAAGIAWRRGRNPGIALAVVLTVADLTTLGRRWVPQCDLEKYPLRPDSPVCAALESERELFRIHRWGPNAFYILRACWPMAYGWQDLAGNFSLAPETVERLPFEANGRFNALLDLANVKYIFTDASFSLPADRFEWVAEADGVRLYRNPRCLPRLQFYTRWEVVSGRQRLLEQLQQDSFDPRQTVLLEEPPAISPATGTASIVVERYTANRVRARVHATSAGILLLADTWYPGWKARVDGRPTRLLRADHILRAVEVPAGEHRVEFYFAPATIRIGGIVSLLTAALTVLVMLVFRRRSASVHSQDADEETR
jgi:hypothetical protein